MVINIPRNGALGDNLADPTESDWMGEIRSYASDARSLKKTHPDASLMKCRKASECMQFHLFYRKYGFLGNKYEPFEKRMDSGKGIGGVGMSKKMELFFGIINDFGNWGSHHPVDGEKVDEMIVDEALGTLRNLFKIIFKEELDKDGDIFAEKPVWKGAEWKGAKWTKKFFIPTSDMYRVIREDMIESYLQEASSTDKDPEPGSPSNILEDDFIDVDPPVDDGVYSIGRFTEGHKKSWPNHPAFASEILLAIISHSGEKLTWSELIHQTKNELKDSRRDLHIERICGDMRYIFGPVKKRKNKTKKRLAKLSSPVDWNRVGSLEEMYTQIRDHHLNTNWFHRWSTDGKPARALANPSKKEIAQIRPYFNDLANELSIDVGDARMIHLIGKGMDASEPNSSGWYDPWVIELSMMSLAPHFDRWGVGVIRVVDMVLNYLDHYEMKTDMRFRPPKEFIRRRQ